MYIDSCFVSDDAGNEAYAMMLAVMCRQWHHGAGYDGDVMLIVCIGHQPKSGEWLLTDNQFCFSQCWQQAWQLQYQFASA